MAHTYTVLLYHIVFSTKHREPVISEEYKDIIYPYVGGTIRNLKGKLLIINGVSDHVHLLCKLPSKPDIAEVVKLIKGSSTSYFRQKTNNRSFAWQDGYGAFTVSYSQKDQVYHYISNQQAHHRKKTFEEEYEEFLKKHEIDYDDRFFLD